MSVTVTTVAELEALREKHESFVLGVFESPDSASAKEFLSLASADESNQYVTSYVDTLRSHLGVAGDVVVVFKTFDDVRSDLDLSNGFDAKAVSAFITSNSHPLVQEFSQEAAKKIFSSAITVRELK